MNDEEFDFLLKIVIIGDSGVGKTNLLCRFTRNAFNQESRPTIGIDFSPKTMKVNGYTVKVQFWDTAGQEKYRSITNAYYKNATGAILVYDITKKDTFTNIKTWLADVREYADSDMTAILIGNKSDLVEERNVTSDDALEFAKKEGIFFMEVSALSNENGCVNQAFNLLIEEIVKKKEKEEKVHAVTGSTGAIININDDKNKQKKKDGGCC